MGRRRSILPCKHCPRALSTPGQKQTLELLAVMARFFKGPMELELHNSISEDKSKASQSKRYCKARPGRDHPPACCPPPPPPGDRRVHWRVRRGSPPPLASRCHWRATTGRGSCYTFKKVLTFPPLPILTFIPRIKHQDHRFELREAIARKKAEFYEKVS